MSFFRSSVMGILIVIYLVYPQYSFAAILPTVTTSTVIQGNAFIPQGTVAPVQLLESPGLRSLFIGKALAFKTLEPIIINGTVVVEKGYVGYVMVTQIRKVVSKREPNDGPEVTYAKVEFRPHSLKTLNWIEVPLTISVWSTLSEVQKSSSINDQFREIIETQLRSTKEKHCGSDCSEQAKFFVAVDADVDLQLKMENILREMPTARKGM